VGQGQGLLCADTGTEQDWEWRKKKTQEMTSEHGLEQSAAQTGADSRHGSRYNTEGTVAHEGI